jgi:hypothetical protein
LELRLALTGPSSEPNGRRLGKSRRTQIRARTLQRSWNGCAVRNDPARAFPGEGHQKPEDAEMARLRREVVKLRGERDIL